MIIGIDASNIRSGGGKKHLENFIKKSLKEDKEIKFILVSNFNINCSFTDECRVTCISNYLLNSKNIFSMLSQLFFSKYYFLKNNCDLVYVPGGIFLSSFNPFVTMSQNMLPFDENERIKFQFIRRLKFRVIKFLQTKTFLKANGLIFLSSNAKNIILNQIGSVKNCIVIPHGIKQQKNNEYSCKSKNFEILYVSDFLPYKNHYNVVKAIVELINEGFEISITLIGQTGSPDYNKIKILLNKNENLNKSIKIKGNIDYEEIPKYFKKSSLFLFASTCENLPFILLEALSFGMPIITTNKSPMKDIVNGDNILFDSLDYISIKETIKNNLDPKKLKEMSNNNYLLSRNYNWTRNIRTTLDYLKSKI